MNKITFLHSSINVIKRKIFKASPIANNHLKLNSTLKYTEWTGKTDHNWHDAANWSNGLPFRYLHAFIPRVPQGNHFPQITEACQIDFTVKNEGIISNQNKVDLTEHGLLQNYGIFKIEEESELNNRGRLINHGTLKNAGHLNSQHIFCNLKTIKNTGTITNESHILHLSALLKSEAGPLSVFDFIKKQKLVSIRKG